MISLDYLPVNAAKHDHAAKVNIDIIAKQVVWYKTDLIEFASVRVKKLI